MISKDRSTQRRLVFMAIAFPVILLFAAGCSLPKYSFSGVSIDRGKYSTFSVYYFPNRARLVNPTLSQSFTEDLKEKLQRQTWLNELEEGGDIEFQGQITNYEVRPMSIQKDDLAAQNRLTVTVKVKYTNNVEPDLSFEQNFSAFEDFDSTQSLSDIEESLVPDIVEKLLEDIFNSSIANW